MKKLVSVILIMLFIGNSSIWALDSELEMPGDSTNDSKFPMVINSKPHFFNQNTDLSSPFFFNSERTTGNESFFDNQRDQLSLIRSRNADDKTAITINGLSLNNRGQIMPMQFYSDPYDNAYVWVAIGGVALLVIALVGVAVWVASP